MALPDINPAKIAANAKLITYRGLTVELAAFLTAVEGMGAAAEAGFLPPEAIAQTMEALQALAAAARKDDKIDLDRGLMALHILMER